MKENTREKTGKVNRMKETNENLLSLKRWLYVMEWKGLVKYGICVKSLAAENGIDLGRVAEAMRKLSEITEELTDRIEESKYRIKK